MHSLSWLATNGTASIVCFPGVLYRGGAEKKIRKYLIDNNFVDCIIQLPDNLFFGTGITTCIMVLKKSKKDNTTLFIDASKEFVKVTNNNKLSETNIMNIVKWFTERTDVDGVVKVVDNSEIEENDYNLSVTEYIYEDEEDVNVDIKELNKELKEIVLQQEKDRKELDSIVDSIM